MYKDSEKIYHELNELISTAIPYYPVLKHLEIKKFGAKCLRK